MKSLQRDEPEVWQVISIAKAVYGDDMGAFLCWLGIRLLEMHRVLAEDGSLYLHIDDTAQAYTKMLLDAIFGRANFRNEIVWQRTTAHNDARRYGANTDRILFYAKGPDWTWNPQHVPHNEAYKARFRLKDADGRAWADDNLTAKGLSGGGYEYEYKGCRSLWRVPIETMRRLDDEGRLHFTSKGGIRRKRYLDETAGRPLQALWTDIDPINSQAKERVGFPTQKPLALYERIIRASSNPGDMVLDPFAGCATTCVAAERLGRQWVGMDIWDGAYKQVLDRLEHEGLAVKGRRERHGQQMLRLGQIKKLTTPPRRTDGRERATRRLLQTPMGEKAERLPHPRTHHGKLLLDLGPFCQGCGADYNFDRRVLEVDHIRPKSDRGSDAYDNLTLLCPPCNKEKRDYYTLTYLQDFNRKNGYMKNENVLQLGRAPKRSRQRVGRSMGNRR